MVIVVCYNFPPFHGCSFLWVPSVTGMNMCLSGVLGWGFTDGRPSEFTAPLHRGNTTSASSRDVNSISILRNDLPPRIFPALPGNPGFPNESLPLEFLVSQPPFGISPHTLPSHVRFLRDTALGETLTIFL